MPLTPAGRFTSSGGISSQGVKKQARQLSPTPGLPGGKAGSRAWCSGLSVTCDLVGLLVHGCLGFWLRKWEVGSGLLLS